MDLKKMEYEEMLRNYKSYKIRKASLQKQYGENEDEIERLKKQNKIETEAINDINNELSKADVSTIDDYSIQLGTIEDELDTLYSRKRHLNLSTFSDSDVGRAFWLFLILLVVDIISVPILTYLGLLRKFFLIMFPVNLAAFIGVIWVPVVINKYYDKKIKKLNERFFQISKEAKKVLENNSKIVRVRKALLSEKSEHEKIIKQNIDRITRLSNCNQRNLEDARFIEFKLERILHKILIKELELVGREELESPTLLDELEDSEEYENPKVKKLGGK